MLKYKAIIADKKDFDAKIITPMKTAVKEGDQITWLNDADKFYSIDMLSYILKNAYNERYIRYDTEEEFIGYFSNIFLTVTPMFYTKISNIIEDKLKELQDNTNVGIKTNIQSKSNRGESGRAFDNTVGDGKQTSTETSDYTMDSRSDNLLDNAKKLSQARISGEVTLYVASFAELFTTLDIEPDLDMSFTPALIAILSDIALAVTKLGHIEVGDGAGGSVDLIDFTGRLMTEQSVDTAIATKIREYDTNIVTPIKNRVTHIGNNQIVQEDGSEIGFDDDTPQKIYNKKASDEYRVVKDKTHLTTQNDIYENVIQGKWYWINQLGDIVLAHVDVKDNTQAIFTSLRSNSGGFQILYTPVLKGNNEAIGYGSAQVSNAFSLITKGFLDSYSNTWNKIDPIKIKDYNSRELRIISKADLPGLPDTYDYLTTTYRIGTIVLYKFGFVDKASNTQMYEYDTSKPNKITAYSADGSANTFDITDLLYIEVKGIL